MLEVYPLTAAFPESERFGLITQLRRAAASVPANIAEGSKRQHAREYARFLNIAEGSLAETEYHFMLARDLGYLAPSEASDILEEAFELARMLAALRLKVEQGA